MPKSDQSASERAEAEAVQQAAAQAEAAAASAEAGAEADVDAALLTPEEKALRAEKIVKDHVLLASGAGLVPSPGFDVLAAFGVQLTMLARLSKLYGVPYSKNIAKGAITSLITSVGGLGFGAVLGLSAVKAIPFVGTALGMVSLPVTMGAMTYGLGKVFSEHFASGGTFLDFSPKSWGPYFRNWFRSGKAVAQEAIAKVKSKKVETGAAEAAAA